ncbi:histidine phosphatase family protein [Mycobacterium sp. ST-F2]|uniref:histidine phosphatase family protein n=1 Tax=Mycobacterium sp. ST-F2 TaxID=1490484 RepID=UPI00143C3754|nr:histidine phosphatase family protein [Mycobacterium sp. ST-F2]
MSSTFRRGTPRRRTLKRALQALTVVVSAAFMFLTSAFSAWAAENITITFVRHGESEGNVSCCLDTTIPGPNLTPTGVQQAADRAQQLNSDGIAYDGIYYSNMVRTKQTAAPFEGLTGMTGTELDGLHEVQAGIYEGAPQNSGLQRILYAFTPLAWAAGMYFVPIPGSPDLTGANFQSRYNGAVEDVYNSGDQNPVVYSHGLAIMAWTLMNVDNPDFGLFFTKPLDNTSVVTVNGNPTDGWTLVNWNGTAVSQNPALFTKLFVDTRKMVTVPQMAVYDVIQAFGTRNIATIAGAIRDGVFDTVKAVANYPVAVTKSIVKSIQTGTVFKAAPPPAPAPTTTAAVEAKDTDTTDKPAVTPTLTKQVSALKTAVTGTKDNTVKAVEETKVDTKADDTKAEDTPQSNTGDKGDDATGTKVKKDKPKKVQKPKKQKKDKAAKADAAK